MSDIEWHHHHDGPNRIIFCRGDTDECAEEYDGLICDGVIWSEEYERFGECHYHIAFGEYVLDVGEQLTLMTHLELVPDEGTT